VNQPTRRATDYALWVDRKGDTEIRFIGREPSSSSMESIARRVTGANTRLAWARQVHSNRVLVANPGECGEGDALISEQLGLALCVVTADCVPVLLADGQRIAAVHAGWRGLVANVLRAAVHRFEHPQRVTAWIGPAIGACCYEVGEDVAARIAAAAGREVISAREPGRPHADLRATATAQLEAVGITDLRHVPLCTRCEDRILWSYRRDGRGGGHNLALIWRRP